MISYETYKLIHVVAIFALFFAVGGAAIHAANRGIRRENAARGGLAALHGVSLLLVLVGGFGMLARLGVKHDSLFPLWLWGKITIWALFTFGMILPYRQPRLAKPMLILTPLLGGIAAFLVIFKPF